MGVVAAEARLAQFRLAQSTLGYVDPVPQVWIGGTDRSANVLRDTLQVVNMLDAPASATFVIRDVAPSEGQEVKISIGSDRNYIFGGHVTRVTQFDILGGLTNDHVGYSVSCQDYTWLLDKQHVFRFYGSDRVESMVHDIIDTYTSGFTALHVEDGLGVGGLDMLTGGAQFTMERVADALSRLAAEVNAYWYVDSAKDIHFYSTDRVPTPHNLTSSYRDFSQVSLETDLSQIVTLVYVEGAGNFLTGYSGSGVALGSSFVLDSAANFPDPGETFDIRVGNYAPVNGRRLRYQRQSTSNQIIDPQVAGDSTYADVQALSPVYNNTEVQLWRIIEDTTAQTALAALDGSNGIREHYIQDRRLSWDGMLNRGQAELDRYKNPIERLRYRTFDPATRPGGRITVGLGAPTSISGTFLIQRTTVTGFSGPGDYTQPFIEVEATSSTRTLQDIYQALLRTV